MRAPLRRAVVFLMGGLAWIGSHGTRAVAALVFIGIALPPIGRVLEPFVTEAIFFLLCVSFMRVDVPALQHYLQRPWIIVAATAWTTVGIPILVGTTCLAIGLNRYSPDLFLGLMLQAVTSPITATPALATLMSLDAVIVLVILVAATLVVPLTAAVSTYFFLRNAFTLSPFSLGLKLFVLLTGAWLVGTAARRLAGKSVISRYTQEIDGLNVLLMLIFVMAMMDTMAARFVSTPLAVIGLGLLAFALFFSMFGLTALLFSGVGRSYAFSIGFVVAQRNMGLMLATTGGVLPGLTWLYFALCQFPIYLGPHLLKRLLPITAPVAPALQPPPD